MKAASNFLADVVIAPILTEKATVLKEKGVYVFKALRKASKSSIKRAVENYFDVKVASVRVVNVKPKIKGAGVSRRRPGRTSAYKKVYVKTKDNAKITSLET
ncbi:50S ribosomal protein L23 [Spirochaetota bacterium]|nr:50S ribosomal protein L23 [Spirochaetota bacterium]